MSYRRRSPEHGSGNGSHPEKKEPRGKVITDGSTSYLPVIDLSQNPEGPDRISGNKGPVDPERLLEEISKAPRKRLSRGAKKGYQR